LAHCVLPLAPDVLAVLMVGAEKSVRVLDYSTPKWDGRVEEMIDEFNGIPPESAPRLVYHRMSKLDFQDLKPHSVAGAIVVCSVPTVPFVGITGVLLDGTTPVENQVMLNDKRYTNTRDATHTVCHELMHAVAGTKDRHHHRPKTSCVWCSLPTPGRFDVVYARRVYEPRK